MSDYSHRQQGDDNVISYSALLIRVKKVNVMWSIFNMYTKLILLLAVFYFHNVSGVGISKF